MNAAMWLECPVREVEAVFSGIAATRMAGIPICNPALSVAAVDFAAWEGEWLGVLVTPWSIGLMLLPGQGGAFRRIEVGESQDWRLPSGEYTFMGSCEPGIGHFQLCSLASPPAEFATQADALAFARAARETALQAGDAALPAGPAAQGAAASQGMSRRGFLRLGSREGRP